MKPFKYRLQSNPAGWETGIVIVKTLYCRIQKMCMYHQQFKKSTTISIFKNWANFHGFTRASSALESDHQHYYYSTYATNYTASYTFSSAFWVNQGHYSDYSTIVLLDYYMWHHQKNSPSNCVYMFYLSQYEKSTIMCNSKLPHTHK